MALPITLNIGFIPLQIGLSPYLLYHLRNNKKLSNNSLLILMILWYSVTDLNGLKVNCETLLTTIPSTFSRQSIDYMWEYTTYSVKYANAPDLKKSWS